jgi:hypothetical protein
MYIQFNIGVWTVKHGAEFLVEAFTSVCGSFAFNIRICPCDRRKCRWLDFVIVNNVICKLDSFFRFWSFVIYTSCLPYRTVCTMCAFPPSSQKQIMLYWNVSVSLGCLYSGKFRTQYYALESRFWICSSWSSKTLLAWCYYQGMSIPFFCIQHQNLPLRSEEM